MNIVLIGASGFIGSALAAEALDRGHLVTALTTRPERIEPRQGLKALACDVRDTSALASVLKGHDAVLSAFSGHGKENVRDYYETGIQSIIEAVKTTGVPRLLVVGGAGSLKGPDGVVLLDGPDFPPPFRPTAEGARSALGFLQNESDLDWTMLSPSLEIFPGQKTGDFRLGSDDLLSDADGRSRISTGDYAVAMIDELESPRHQCQRFTVGY